jgi:hypothetical protein
MDDPLGTQPVRGDFNRAFRIAAAAVPAKAAVRPRCLLNALAYSWIQKVKHFAALYLL